MTGDEFDVPLRGVGMDGETRCVHYDSDSDVIAIRFPCCETYYPCFRCHEALTDHDAVRIPRQARDDPGVLCGCCGSTLTVNGYLNCGDRCPRCDAAFNPGCRRHHDRYFVGSREDS